MKYLGEQDPNAILRGEVDTSQGDKFISSTEDMKGFLAFEFTPKVPEPPKAYMHFRFLGRGTRSTCEDLCAP